MDFEQYCINKGIRFNPEQRRAIERTDGPTLMISVPGSGKTTVIISRIAHMIAVNGISPDSILTVTFSVDAAKTMRAKYTEVFEELTPDAAPEFSTVHSAALKIVRHYHRIRGLKQGRIMENTHSVISMLIKENNEGRFSDRSVTETVNHISKAANGMLSKDEIADISIRGIDFAEIFDKYTEYKKENNLMDFDDILAFSLSILRNNPDILAYFQNKYIYYNVDEAQDNSLIQNRIIETLTSKHNNLFMVGDEDQCIYGFRGAYPNAFFEFSKKWGEENIIKLQTNYRSDDLILQVAESFISQNRNRYFKKLTGVQNRPGRVETVTFTDAAERNDYISSDCIYYSTAAVISRNNDSLISIADSLIQKNINFSIRAGKNELFSSVITKNILKILKVSSGMEDYGDLPGYIKRMIGESRRLYEMNNMNAASAIRYLVKELNYSKILSAFFIDGYGRQGMLNKLNILTCLAEKLSITDFIIKTENLNRVFSEGRTADNSTPAVSLLTCHASKGLEFEKVYIIDSIDRIFPNCGFFESDNTTKSMDYEEEVRLFYVALTRAEREIEILNTRQAYWGNSSPSIFVKEIRGYINGIQQKNSYQRLRS